MKRARFGVVGGNNPPQCLMTFGSLERKQERINACPCLGGLKKRLRLRKVFLFASPAFPEIRKIFFRNFGGLGGVYSRPAPKSVVYAPLPFWRASARQSNF